MEVDEVRREVCGREASWVWLTPVRGWEEMRYHMLSRAVLPRQC